MNIQPCGQRSSVAQPVICRIRVQGRISADWADRFEGLAINTTPAAPAQVITTLEGELSDQAALVGVINSLHDLRLPVLSVECQNSLSTGDADALVSAFTGSA